MLFPSFGLWDIFASDLMPLIVMPEPRARHRRSGDRAHKRWKKARASGRR